MSLVVISLLLLGCAAHGVCSLEDGIEELLKRSSISQASRRRHLLSSISNAGNTADGNLNTQDTATYRIHRDWLTEDHIPHPELYYQDLDTGERQLIWAFDDTLARDVLAGRPDVWLQTTFQVEHDVDLLLPFLEHYSRLGIHFKRMIFTLVASNLHSTELLHVQKALRKVGAVHSTLLLKEENCRFCRSKGYRKAVFEANVRSTYNVPIKDWIITVEGSELAEFQLPRNSGGGGGGGRSSRSSSKIVVEEEEESSVVSAEEFFETLELQGINWVAGLPIERLSSSGFFENINGNGKVSGARGLGQKFPLKCQFRSTFPAENRMKVVAYRGYLRPDMSRRSIIPAEEAKLYFSGQDNENSDSGDGGDGDGSSDKGVSLFNLTPYSQYWEFYKTSLMVGNVYLWSAWSGSDRTAVLAKLYRFRWHSSSSLSSLNFSEISQKKAVSLCDDDTVEEHDAMVFDKLQKAGKVDLHGGDEDGIKCDKEAVVAEEEEKKEEVLPLGREAALSLAALHSIE
jgi:hypothetical protein